MTMSPPLFFYAPLLLGLSASLLLCLSSLLYPLLSRAAPRKLAKPRFRPSQREGEAVCKCVLRGAKSPKPARKIYPNFLVALNRKIRYYPRARRATVRIVARKADE
jgi:hypothetical protein